ncbi:EamA family transporter [Bacillus paranthracis]
MSVLGYLWWNNGIAQIGAARTSLFFNLVPVVTMIISFFRGSKYSTRTMYRDAIGYYGSIVFIRFYTNKIKRKCEYLTFFV